ncbi:MAG: KGK domain-containing protein [Trichodesmium sp. St18_bin1]|nr:KGK domain-containing protein [Trichodesmium sp. St18_bin1]MDE5124114.1 KGK domain-containing protein [Trichodesmium sp. St19_bin1]
MIKSFVVLNLYDVVQLNQNVCDVLGLKRNEFVCSFLIIEQLKFLIMSKIPKNYSSSFEIQKKLFDYGLDTWILRPGAQSWKKEKLKIELTVKFYPDELEEEIEENKAENSDNNNPEVLSGGEVLQIHGSTGENLGLSLNFEDLYMTVGQLQKLIIRVADIYDRNNIKNQLFYNGLECNVLRPNTPGWQGGKLKVELPIKFYLDESLEEIEKNELSNSENQGENSGDNNLEVMATEPSPLDDLREKFNQENQ